MWTLTLPLTLLAIIVASSATAEPIDNYEDYSDIGFLSHPDDVTVLYRDADDEEVQWNDHVQADESRHLAKRSPVPPFDPISKKLKKKAKKLLLKVKKLKPLIKKGAKLAALAGGTGLAGFGMTSSLPGLPALPALGAAGAGAPVGASVPLLSQMMSMGQSNRNRGQRRRGKRSPFSPNLIPNGPQDLFQEGLWNEISQVDDEPKHLTKRSPIPPFDPISKKLKKKTKKLLLKAKKVKPLIKKLAKVSVPLAGFGLARGRPNPLGFLRNIG